MNLVACRQFLKKPQLEKAVVFFFRMKRRKPMIDGLLMRIGKNLDCVMVWLDFFFFFGGFRKKITYLLVLYINDLVR